MRHLHFCDFMMLFGFMVLSCSMVVSTTAGWVA